MEDQVTEINFDEKLAHITDESTPLEISALYALSNIKPENFAKFKSAWAGLSTERKRKIAANLPELAELDVQLEFSDVALFLLQDKDDEVRIAAIDSLYENESRDLLKVLLDIAENSNEAEALREKAVLALARFAYMAEMEELPARWITRTHDTLLKLAEDEQDRLTIGRRAVEAVGYFGNDDEVRQVIQSAYKSDDELVQASAVAAMGRNADTRWLPEIGQQLGSDTPALRYEAARAVGELGARELLNPLIQLTDDEDLEVRLAAIWSLGQVSGPEAKRTLQELASNGSTEAVREAAEDALQEITFNDSPMGMIG